MPAVRFVSLARRRCAPLAGQPKASIFVTLRYVDVAPYRQQALSLSATLFRVKSSSQQHYGSPSAAETTLWNGSINHPASALRLLGSRVLSDGQSTAQTIASARSHTAAHPPGEIAEHIPRAHAVASGAALGDARFRCHKAVGFTMILLFGK